MHGEPVGIPDVPFELLTTGEAGATMETKGEKQC